MILPMNNVKLVSVPLASHFKLYSSLRPSTKKEKEYMSRIPYSNAVGSLMYVMVSTRLDISHAVGVVSGYMTNPGKEHWAIVKWVLQYLRDTSDYCITYNSGFELVCGYVDSDFAGDLDKRRSTSRYVFTLPVDPLVGCQSVIEHCYFIHYRSIICRRFTWLERHSLVERFVW
jgi:hypothetical protein